MDKERPGTRTRARALTSQQEKFAQSIASGTSQAEAYREAYPKSLTWKPESVWTKASVLAADVKVRQRVEALRQPVVEAAQLTLSGHIAELERLKSLAEAENQLSTALKAEELRGKVSGFYVDRAEVGPPGSFPDHSDDELRQEIKRALKDAHVTLEDP